MIFEGKTVLHVGCGGSPLPAWLAGCTETRLDIDGQHKPHIVADMRSLEGVGRYDVIYCNHALEHLYPHEVVPALAGFRAALCDGGVAFVIVPDLDGIRPTAEVVYESPSGPITGLDMIYGHAGLIPSMPFMAHHTGFVAETLEAALRGAGFSAACVRADEGHNLIGAGVA